MLLCLAAQGSAQLVQNLIHVPRPFWTDMSYKAKCPAWGLHAKPATCKGSTTFAFLSTDACCLSITNLTMRPNALEKAERNGDTGEGKLTHCSSPTEPQGKPAYCRNVCLCPPFSLWEASIRHSSKLPDSVDLGLLVKGTCILESSTTISMEQWAQPGYT